MNVFEGVVIKIVKIRLKNYKNVLKGEIQLSDEKEIEEGKGSITGIYGQNGSGKTTIINAISLIKRLFKGETLPEDVSEYIAAGRDTADLKVDFYLDCGEGRSDYSVEYMCSISKCEERTYISEETVKYRVRKWGEEKWSRETGLLINKYDKRELLPKYRNDTVVKLYDTEIDLLVDKKIAHEANKSFIFSEHFIRLLTKKADELPEEFGVLGILKLFATTGLFVIDNKRMALSDANIILPIAFKNFNDKKDRSFGQIPIALNKPAELPEKAMNEIKKVLEASNKVLREIIPGLSVEVMEMGKRLSETGEEITSFELMSCRQTIKIPVRYESDGIKKIIAILHMLIALYNSKTITVLIDELDSGIFEYLLGEILQIVEEKSKGQLIFTSHNLRPLEILNKNNLVFTTVNPENRYIRFKNIKKNHNLRDTYYRDIVLGGQEEEVYYATNSAKISRAFRKAGEKK